MGKLIIAPSEALVEIKEIKEKVSLVYQLDKNNNRIKKINLKGEPIFLIGLVTTDKIQNQL